ncbi:MAG: glycine cleavage system protein GcvH [Spirochaetes bacterium]|nr:glycine cleavage system protein GcvH [Spirochaetota bacterium]
MYRYTKDHAWVLAEGTRARIGISDFAQRELGDVAYVALPRTGQALKRGEAACTVDSLKSSSEIYSPLSGTIVEANAALQRGEGARAINADPLGEGWLFALELADPSELELLLSEAEYARYIEGN